MSQKKKNKKNVPSKGIQKKVAEQKRRQEIVSLIIGLSDLATVSTHRDNGEETIELAWMMARDLSHLLYPAMRITRFYLSADKRIFEERGAAELHHTRTGNEFVAIIAPTLDEKFVQAIWQQFFKPNDPHVHLFEEAPCTGDCDACDACGGAERNPPAALYT